MTQVTSNIVRFALKLRLIYIFQAQQCIIFLYYLVCEAIGTFGHFWPIVQPRVIVKVIVKKQMECRLAGETEVLGENLPQRHFSPSQNPT
jgi:hypothetical protein